MEMAGLKSYTESVDKMKQDGSRNVLRPFGATGFRFSSIGLGTWDMEKDAPASIRALRAGLDAGANHIDTAEMYGSGEVEKIVGTAVQGRRERVYIVSKVLPSHARYEDTLAACERSLQRLKTDYLDVYLLHWPERNTPVEETFRAFRKLKQEGKIRTWGVSNFDVRDLQEAFSLTEEGEIACNQVLYHLEERAIEFGLDRLCKSRRAAIVAYSPFGHSGALPKSSVLNEVAQAHGATTAQIILAFLTRDPNFFAIPKSADAGRARENASAMRLKLSPDDIRRIEAAFPPRLRKTLPTL